ncbi:hypothetical protein [Bordetella parapertussis]|uniref:hypothetical protein n=1 Tax=Bordetella parapertussis TaxID=519 RepID=UPI001CF77F78|nr:hypothetical protein [Bordetella parapertussis]MEB2661587.1 hypothetical protein [Bordetella parapertussis]MEB2670231.1 hypothetical protein [Bordetella parapertussis]UEB07219.1 hypothetical protein LK409_01400 [Bordetella parapertussis]UEB19062.1 hypothetical protein LK435_07860 [Bordetella parapertussis]
MRDADLRGARCLRTQLHRALQDGARWDSRIGVLENDPALYEAELWSARRRAGP